MFEEGPGLGTGLEVREIKCRASSGGYMVDYLDAVYSRYKNVIVGGHSYIEYILKSRDAMKFIYITIIW